MIRKVGMLLVLVEGICRVIMRKIVVMRKIGRKVRTLKGGIEEIKEGILNKILIVMITVVGVKEREVGVERMNLTRDRTKGNREREGQIMIMTL